MSRTPVQNDGSVGQYDVPADTQCDLERHQWPGSENTPLKNKLLCLLAGGSLSDIASCVEVCVQTQPEYPRTSFDVGGSYFFAEAVLNGRLDVVEYIGTHFRTKFRQFLESEAADLPESPFHTACKLYDAQLVRLLISCGASVHRPDTHGLPPLHAAVSGRRTDVVEALLEHGASVNQEDCYGWTPLCVAVCRPEMITCLLQRGADVKHKLSSGFTVLHLAAQRGSQYLEPFFTADNTPMASLFQEVPPVASRRDEDYVPCPLFLAAANGHSLLVKVLVEHPECPRSCKADAMLLLCIARHCRLGRKGDGITGEFHYEPRFIEEWKESLYFREANNLGLPQLQRTEIYGNRTEVCTVQELDAIEHSMKDIVYQSVIAYERCLGYRRHNGELAFLLRCAVDYFLRDKENCQQGELLLERALGLREYLPPSHPCSITIYPDTYLQLMSPLFKYWLCSKVEAFCIHSYKIRCYPALLGALLDLQEQSRWLSHSAKHTLVSTVVHGMLLLLYDWHNNLGCNGTSDFQRLGRQFVSGNLHVSPGVTLLHFMLSHQVMAKLSKVGVPSFSSFASHTLRWGAASIINQPDPSGKRPIHHAYEVAKSLGISSWESIVSPFVEHGAHRDAVDRSGGCVPFHPATLICLSCLAAKKIVHSGIPYRTLTILHPHIKGLIALHDPS